MESDSVRISICGSIQAIYPYEDLVAIVCNEEGKLNGLPLNRAIRDEKGKIIDVIAGTAFICDCSEDELQSLSPTLIDKYLDKFKEPERFVMINGKIVVIK